MRQFIAQYHMLSAGDAVVAGVSGGADSVCLLLLLCGLRREIGFSLSAVHVEHGIRGEESREDAVFTERLCGELGVPFKLYTVDVPRCREETGLSEEEAARELRYDCFRKACAAVGADRIALAHHADDCAETMLFHLSRGTGIRGLGSIRPVAERTASADDGMPDETEVGPQGASGAAGHLTVIRPLLCVTRKEIEDWLAGRGQAYRTDSTNTDTAYARNRIRERVLPELAQINKQAVPHMQLLAGHLAEISDYLDEAAREAGREAVSFPAGPEADGEAAGKPVCVICCSAFLEIRPVLQKQLLLQVIGLAAGGRRDITAVHVDQLLRLMTARVGSKASLPGRVTAEKTYDAVVLRTEPAEISSIRGQDLVIPGETILDNGLLFSTEIIESADFSKKIPQKTYTKWFDYDKINFAVRLRGRLPGDYLLLDAGGGHKKLNRFFIDEKVPLGERDRICLLADGDHIMWVVGYRISEAYKVTGETKRVLCVTVSGTEGQGMSGGTACVQEGWVRGEPGEGEDADV